ncbi:MAG TPA: class I SAM-dependent methyltransferase [Anaerolineales bacterium]|nr:class I SAM-dependent methyltransferase [Anaerolineales bacterium]
MKTDIERVHRPGGNARTNYNAMSRWYDLFTSSEKRFTDIGLQILDVRPNESVLEIGCGTGHALVEFANRGAQVIAMDLSEGMINAAQRRIQNKVQKRSVEFCQGDGLFVPFPEDQFDVIFLSFTLELFDTPKIPLVLNECHRTLRSGGRIGVVSLAKQDKAAVRIYEWFHRLMPNIIDCRPIYLGPVLKEAGFLIDKSIIKTMWGLPVEIVIARK